MATPHVMKIALCVVTAGLPLVALTGPVLALSDDGDGIPDVLDTCTYVANAGDCDGDLDGYGNACDADLTEDGLHTAADIAPLIEAIRASDPIGDQTCDGLLTGADVAPFVAVLISTSTPGPSGLPCAGTIPCQ